MAVCETQRHGRYPSSPLPGDSAYSRDNVTTRTAAHPTAVPTGLAGSWQRLNAVERVSVTGLASLLILRIWAMCVVPLYESTEARYAEISRKMLETGNWITPQFDYGDPFWAKPPLMFWLSGLSQKLFGVNEFAARLPSFLCALVTLGCTYYLARRFADKTVAWLATVVLTSSFLFFMSSGTVMTDPSLAASVAIALTAFAVAWHSGGRSSGYLVFAALGVGLLAKGPLAVVIAGLPVVILLGTAAAWKRLWTHLPWLGGSLLMCAIAVPWYLLAERATPGFLNYFIVGEHIQRFLVGHWQGDRYGHAHEEMRGTIWLYGLLSLMPWTPWLMWRAVTRAPFWRRLIPRTDFDKLLWAWAILPLLFFTVARNILFPYVLPVLPAWAILLARWLAPRNGSEPWRRRLALPIYGFVGLGVLSLIALPLVGEKLNLPTQRDAIAYVRAQPGGATARIFYYPHRHMSAEFYSNGSARTLRQDSDLRGLAEQRDPSWLLVEAQDYPRVPADVRRHFRPAAERNGVKILEHLS
jgi:4-amino-4-deoxy-L-arabinose transferase-like glycosyltransferase